MLLLILLRIHGRGPPLINTKPQANCYLKVVIGNGVKGEKGKTGMGGTDGIDRLVWEARDKREGPMGKLSPNHAMFPVDIGR